MKVYEQEYIDEKIGRVIKTYVKKNHTHSEK